MGSTGFVRHLINYVSSEFARTKTIMPDIRELCKGQWLSCKSYASYYHGTSGVKQLHCVVANLFLSVQLFCSNGKIRRCFVTSYLQGWSHTATGHILPLFSTRKPIPTKLFCSIFRKALLSHRLYIYIYTYACFRVMLFTKILAILIAYISFNQFFFKLQILLVFTLTLTIRTITYW